MFRSYHLRSTICEKWRSKSNPFTKRAFISLAVTHNGHAFVVKPSARTPSYESVEVAQFRGMPPLFPRVIYVTSSLYVLQYVSNPFRFYFSLFLDSSSDHEIPGWATIGGGRSVVCMVMIIIMMIIMTKTIIMRCEEDSSAPFQTVRFHADEEPTH